MTERIAIFLQTSGIQKQLPSGDTFQDIGKVVQVDKATDAVYRTTASTIPADNSFPRITEGFNLSSLSITFTPIDGVNNNLIHIISMALSATAGFVVVALFNGNTNAIFASMRFQDNGEARVTQRHMTHINVAPGASAKTYTVRMGTNAGTTILNGRAGGGFTRLYGGALIASHTIIEYTP